MSKIQEALDKIRAGQAVAPVVREPTQAPDGSSAPTMPYSSADTVQPNAGISKMGEGGVRTELELAKLRTLSAGMRDALAMNAIRELRTSVLQRLDGDKRILMVTSTRARAGTSFVARNLAAAIALDEAKTSLIVDCNLKHPSLSELSIDKKKIGLREFLKNTEINVEDIIHQTGIPRVRVIPAGGKVDGIQELFTSMRLRHLLEELKRRYPERYIVLDAPPIMESADSRILAEVCDYAALVVPFGRNTTNQVVLSARAIGKEKFMGLVFNKKPAMPRLRW